MAIYADPPYLLSTRSDGGSRSHYEHEFSAGDHQRWATALSRFKKARVVVSYYDSPLLALLYPDWIKMNCARNKNMHVQHKRGSEASIAPEVLLLNGAEVTGQFY